MRKLLLLLTVLVMSYQAGLCEGISLTVGNLSFSIEGNEATCWGCNEGSTLGDTLKIPSHVEYDGKEYPVTEISYWGFSFSNISQVSTLILPNTLVKIGDNAFCGGGFTSLEIPESVKYLCGFAQCKNLKEIKIPKSVQKIGPNAFSSCSGLVKAVIEAEVDTIPAGLFAQCFNLQEVSLPSSVKVFAGKEYYSGAFMECFNLKQITLPENLTTIGRGTFQGTGFESVTLPESVTEIGPWAFGNCRMLKSIDLPENLTVLNYGTFENCISLESIKIPDKVTAILSDYSWGGGCFYGCSSLKNVTFGKSLKTIGDATFYLCENLTEINLAAPIDSIGENAFSSCKNLRTVNIGSALTKISSYAFRDCGNIEAFNLDSGNSAFCSVDGCIYDRAKTRLIMAPPAIKGSINIPAGVKEIGDYAFSGCKNITEINIPDGVTRIGNEAMNGCEGLTGIRLPETLEEIGYNALAGTKIEKLHIPASVNKLGNGFCDQDYLKAITVDEGNKTYSSLDGLLFDSKKETLIRVPGGMDGSLKLPDCVLTLGPGSLAGCKAISDIKFNGSLKKIEASAIASCTSLTSLSIPDNVTEIGTYAFYNCKNLKEIKFPDNLKVFNEGICSHCSSLSKFNFPTTLDTVMYIAFRGCAIETLEIPATVKELRSNSFDECQSLKKITFLGTTKLTGAGIFSYCTSVDSILSYSPVPPEAIPSAFANYYEEIYSRAILMVPEEGIDAYRQTHGWGGFRNIRNFPNNNNHALEVEIVTPGENHWSGPTINCDLTSKMASGVKYKLSMRIKGTKAAEGDNGILISLTGIWPTIPVTTEWSVYTTEFTLNDDPWGAVIQFMPGTYDGKLWIDDVVITAENSDDNLVINSDFEEKGIEGWRVWESANMSRVIANDDVTSSVPTVSMPIEENRWIVYDFSGRLVLDTRDHQQVTDLPSGLYIINGKKILKR